MKEKPNSIHVYEGCHYSGLNRLRKLCCVFRITIYSETAINKKEKHNIVISVDFTYGLAHHSYSCSELGSSIPGQFSSSCSGFLSNFQIINQTIYIFPIFISFHLVAPYITYHFHLLHCIHHHLVYRSIQIMSYFICHSISPTFIQHCIHSIILIHPTPHLFIYYFL